MFGRLLTPLRGHFDPSPRPEAPQEYRNDDTLLSAENFARDVLIELMKNSVESMKDAQKLEAKIEVMDEMLRIMLQDACTKDVFRELDGYLPLVSVLSTLHSSLEDAEKVLEEKVLMQISEGARLAFTIIAESLKGHPHNRIFYETQVGYEYLGQAISGLVRDPRTVDFTFGFLISLALENFALSELFSTLRTADNLDLAAFKPLLETIQHPQAFGLVFRLLSEVPDSDDLLRRTVYALTEHFVTLNHRNQALLCDLNLIGPLQERFVNVDASAPAQLSERPVIQKITKRLLEMGAETSVARSIFQHAVRDDGALDEDVLDILRSGMKTKWPTHFSMEGRSALELRDTTAKGLPTDGFVFMIWLWVEQYPTTESYVIWKAGGPLRPLISLALRPDGKLELMSAGNREVAVLETAKIPKLRWTHLALIHHPHRSANPTIRVFIDGFIADTRNWAYPRSDASVQAMIYTIGDQSRDASASWCIASAYLLSLLDYADDLPRLAHHLGSRYSANFQAPDLVRFFTYETSTALNIFLSALASKRGSLPELSPLFKAIKGDVAISENSIIFSFSPQGYVAGMEDGKPSRYIVNAVGSTPSRAKAELKGDVFVARPQCLDSALWKIGGPAVTLRLVEMASNPHELSRAVGILADGVRSSWQNSEDMERIRGYDILAHILRRKSQLMNVTCFEILFEFLGINSRSPDHSTVINTLAYRTLALDFEIWSGARTEIQRVHLDHFTTLLKTSRYKQFNAKQRLAKLGIIRKILFVLQTDWYPQDMIPDLITALKIVAQACFSTDDTIKPIVSYLAANLHEDSSVATSPRSSISRFDKAHSKEKAEHVLEALLSVLSSPSSFSKFSGVLPVTRICLLLLGEHPTPFVASHILLLIGLALKASASFNRKFELVSGWTVLKMVLPSAWDASVHAAAFDVLLGRISSREKGRDERSPTVSSPNIIPAILMSLQLGLQSITDSNSLQAPTCTTNESTTQPTSATHPCVEFLLEELINLQSSSSSFRQVFKSQQTTSLVITAYKSCVESMSSVSHLGPDFVRILEKMNHFVLSLTLDKAVASSQKQELSKYLQQAESVLNSNWPQTPPLESPPVDDSKTSKTQMETTLSTVQIASNRAYQKTISRIRDWRQTIIQTEQNRLRRTLLDLREYYRQAERLDQWRHALLNERGLWKVDAPLYGWALDETEGPYRVRKKMEPQLGLFHVTKTHPNAARNVAEPELDAQSIVQVEVPPWAEGYEFKVTDIEDDQKWIDDVAEDKHRRVRHELEPGDVIEAVSTVARIVGVDSSPGLLILGRKHLYMLDGLVENEDGDVIDAHDAPKNLFSVPGTLLDLDGRQRAQHWKYEQVTAYSKRTCLFRDVAFEIYFKDSRSLLVVFASKESRQDMSDKLTSLVGSRSLTEPKSPILLRTPLLGRVSARVFTSFRDEIGTAQRKWQTREISNFSYLSILNQTSGRTPGDATQYPVFPWVIEDYSSETLDLTQTITFRDLTRPMGALTESRRAAAQSRYTSLQSVQEIPFHYGTHFSSSMITCHFLIRLAPFTQMFKTLQGGDWDLPDRLFSDICRAYNSASQDVRGDVRELIPEFFSCPEFLENSANWDFGVQQNTGERIHDVKLPPWAKQDPLLFIIENRRALESDYVSEHLPAWIDLIWGCKQRDQQSLNVFHPLSYEGSIDLDSIADELQREATVGIIHNFGQTPRKLFQAPHPARIMQGVTTLPLGTSYGIEEHAHLLLQSPRPVNDISTPVAELAIDVVSERVLPCRKETLYVPQYPHEQIMWGYVDQSLRLFVDRKVVQVAELISCTCAAFANADVLVTGSRDCTVRLWQLTRKDGSAKMSQTHIMRTHTGSVLCIAACRAWSIIVSGSEDGTAVIWDLNRAAYVKSIWHGNDGDRNDTDKAGVRLVAINESTGYIATCSLNRLCLHTVNARLIVQMDLSAAYPSESIITSLAFHEREYSRRGVLAAGAANGTITLRTWTTAGTAAGEKAKWTFATLKALKCREGSDGRMPKVTAIKFIGESLYHGEDSGKVFSWELSD